jgi:hypothetical protein
VLDCDEVIELDMPHLGKSMLGLALPFLGHASEEGQFACDRGPVEVEEKGDAPQRNPGTQELVDLGISTALMLPIWLLEGGGREVKFAPIAPPSFHQFSLRAAVEGSVFAKLKRIAVGIGAAFDHEGEPMQTLDQRAGTPVSRESATPK